MDSKSALLLHIKGNESKDVMIYFVEDINEPNIKTKAIGCVQKIAISQDSDSVFPIISLETCSISIFETSRLISQKDFYGYEQFKNGVLILACERESFGPEFGRSLVCNSIIGTFKEKYEDDAPFINNIDSISCIDSFSFETDTYSKVNKFNIRFAKEQPNHSELIDVGCNVVYK